MANLYSRSWLFKRALRTRPWTRCVITPMLYLDSLRHNTDALPGLAASQHRCSTITQQRSSIIISTPHKILFPWLRAIYCLSACYLQCLHVSDILFKCMLSAMLMRERYIVLVHAICNAYKRAIYCLSAWYLQCLQASDILFKCMLSAMLTSERYIV